ncbi:hypothetical protein KRP22_015239 [Phytophthora ramorum]|nr:putative ankyrin repeat protein [Phytophthora ramorum]
MRNKENRLREAAKMGYIATVNELVQNGTDINARDNDGLTPLIWAARCGLDVVRCLVEQGADKEAKANNGDTALIWAAWLGHQSVVRYLVEQGADIEAKNNEGNTVLAMTAYVGQLNVVRYLVKQGADKEAKNNYGNTVLIGAPSSDNLDVVRHLVEQGADINAKNNVGKTALIGAASRGNLEMVRYLAEQGVDGSCLDTDGSTVLILLLLRDDAKEDILLPVVKLLLECGMPPLQYNNKGKSAKSIAKVNNFRDIAALVREYPSKSRWPEASWVISHADIVKTEGLAVGGFGTVYRAEWAHTEVVVKEISVVEMRRFLREVNTWRGFTHDNVVPFYGANHRKEPFFIVSN